MGTSDVALSAVLSPLTIKGVTLRNRVVRTAHGTNIGRGRVDDDLIAYHVARARGGVGLTILEAASVHPTDAGTLRLHDDSCVADFRRLMDAIRPTGMAVFAQLGHLGHEGVPMAPYSQPWSASAVRSASMRVAKAMTLDDIEEITVAFARAAGWVREGGLDGVEVHAAHGYLLEQFMSPVTNQRQDRYGGSWDNRIRLTCEIVEAVRRAVGDDFVVGVRTGADATEQGVQADDCADLIDTLQGRGLVDYVNVTFGSCLAPHKIIGAMHEPTGYELPTSEVVTKRSRLPTIVTGRFGTLVDAGEVIRTGLADLVGMTRAHIADPDLVAKTVAGRAREVRPCIACNQGCVGGLGLGRLACAVNPDVGFERTHEHAYEPVATPRTVVVVGGGPAGMEAARVAAARGHRVALYESAPALGGSLRDARRLPERQLIGRAADWLEEELARRSVDVHLGAGPDAIGDAARAADVVVVATGAATRREPGQWSSAEVAALEGAPPGARTAAVLDRFGDYQAVGVAERLAGWGIDVTVHTGPGGLGARSLRELTVVPAQQRMDGLPGVVDTTDGDPSPSADLVVVIDPRPSPLDLGPLSAEVHLAGDAAYPGNLWAAIRSGNAIGRTI